jgi:hypothetical protein
VGYVQISIQAGIFIFLIGVGFGSCYMSNKFVSHYTSNGSWTLLHILQTFFQNDRDYSEVLNVRLIQNNLENL